MRLLIVFLLISAAYGVPVDKPSSTGGSSAGPVLAAAAAVALPSPKSSDANSDPKSNDSPKSAAPISKQDENRKHHGSQSRFPTFGGGYYPPAIQYVRPQPYYGLAPSPAQFINKPAPIHVAAPVIQPVAQPHIPVTVHAPPAVAAVAHHTTFSKPIVSYRPQMVQRPAHLVSEHVIHRPVIIERQEIIRRPIFTEVTEVVHKPYFTEYQQAYKLPTYTQHIIKRPYYNAVKQESVHAPVHLAGEQYHIVAPPSAGQIYNAPPQYVQPYSSEVVQVPVVSHQTETHTTVQPVAHYAPAAIVAPEETYEQSYLSESTCRAGDDCEIENDVNGKDVLVVRKPVVAADYSYYPEQHQQYVAADSIVPAVAAQPSYYYSPSSYYYNPLYDRNRGKSGDAESGSFEYAAVYNTNAVEDDMNTAAMSGAAAESDKNRIATEVGVVDDNWLTGDENKFNKLLARSLATDESFIQKLYSTMDTVSAELQKEKSAAAAAVAESRPSKSKEQLLKSIDNMNDEDRSNLRKILEEMEKPFSNGEKLKNEDALMAKSNDKKNSS